MNNRIRILLYALACLMPMSLMANHWTPVSAPYEDNMTLTGVVQINGVEQQSTTLELGAFCGAECRGTAMAMVFPATGRYVYPLTIFGNNGDQITFKLYDQSQGVELSLQSPDAVTFGANGMGSVVNPYVLNFTEVNPGANHWTPVSAPYEDNMTLSGVVQINGVEQQSTTLELGAFCGAECRGTAMAMVFPATGRYVYPLTIFGNNGDQITFKLYDQSQGVELSLQSPSAVTFGANGMGSVVNPYVLNFTSTTSTVTQTIHLSLGWNWISTYIEAENPLAMLQMLESALGDNASQISSAELFTENDGGDWWGELDEEGILNEQMYMILANTSFTIELQGQPANPANHAITINPGWNWIGFPCDHQMSIEEALGGFNAEEGDMVANSEMFTEFEDGEWFGDVAILIPGQGFMYFSNSTVSKMLVIGG